MSLHIGNPFAEKRGFWQKLFLTVRFFFLLQEHMDVVAGDFNGRVAPPMRQ